MIKKFAIYFISFTSISLLLNFIFDNFFGKSISASVIGGIFFAGFMILVPKKKEQS